MMSKHTIKITKDWEHFIKPFSFKNTLEEPEADFFSITNNIIWRRDTTRLVCYRLDTSLTKQYHFNYSFNEFDKLKKMDSFYLSNDGTLVDANNSSNFIRTSNIHLEKNSLSLLKNNDFSCVFELKNQFITHLLTILQKKVHHNNVNPEQAYLTFDLTNKTATLHPFDESVFDIEFESCLKIKPLIVSYSFNMMKSLFLTSKKLNNTITFHINHPYYTLFKYNKNAFSILTHKRDIKF